MSPELKELEQQALRLSAEDRELLANHLFQSVHNQALNEIDEAWMQLAEERFRAWKEHPESGVGEKEFFERIEQKLGWS